MQGKINNDGLDVLLMVGINCIEKSDVFVLIAPTQMTVGCVFEYCFFAAAYEREIRKHCLTLHNFGQELICFTRFLC